MKSLAQHLIERKKYHFLDPSKRHEINVFDIDDTLVLTDAKIKVTDYKTGESFELTPEQFNSYKALPSHKQDFSDFLSLDILKAGKLIEWTVNILKKTIAKKKAVGIITARSDRKLIKDFLKYYGMNINYDFIFAINEPGSGFSGTTSQKKTQAFKELMDNGFNTFRFFDDDKENIKLAKDLAKEYPDIKMDAKWIKPEWRK